MAMTPEEFRRQMLCRMYEIKWPPRTVYAASWKAAMEFYDDLRDQGAGKYKWVFRGMGNYKWKLQTSLERAMARFEIKPEKAFETENGLLREFKRHFHHYETYLPDDRETVEWLAMMQHHFAPTRFLDWTRSFYVALYFALEKAEGDSAVWCIDEEWCSNQVMKSLARTNTYIPGKVPYNPREFCIKNEVIPFGKDSVAFDAVFCDVRSEAFVYPLNPLRLNERLAIQQDCSSAPAISKSLLKTT